MLPSPQFSSFIVALSLSPVAKGDSSARVGITFFRADVTVREDATLEVHEEITVNDGASYYKYGFRRDLPITLNDRWDPRYVGSSNEDNDIRVSILEVTQDSRPASYIQGTGYGYSQIFIGVQNTPLEAGEHHFELRYTVDGAVTSPTGRDRLYWNAIGLEHNAPVAEAIVAIHLPATIPSQNIDVESRIGGRGNHPKIPPVNNLERVQDSTGAIIYRAVNCYAAEPRPGRQLAVWLYRGDEISSPSS